MILYGIYVVFTVIEDYCAVNSRMPLFDSMTLTFGTVGTGGFGLLNSSIASYSTAVQIIITVFMIICSISLLYIICFD